MLTICPTADYELYLGRNLLDADGAVESVSILRGSPPFDDAAVKTVRAWLFRPARPNGVRAPALVYVVFGFRPPV